MDNQNNLFREIFKRSPIGILFYDKEGKLIDANQSALEILRVSQFKDIKGINLFINPDIEYREEELLKNGFIRFQSSSDLDNTKKSGIYTPTESGIIYIDYTVSVTNSGFLMQIQDITEQKKTDEKLIQKHDLLETILESFEGPVFSVDCDYRYTNFNMQHAKVMKNLFDVDIEIGGNILDYHTNLENRKSAKLNIDKAFNGETVNIESFAGDKPQNYRYFSIFHTPIRDSKGKVTGAAIYAHDITERKKVEDKNKSILENIQEYYIEFDNEWRFVDINSKYEEEVGIKKDELIGKVIWDVFPQIVNTKAYKEYHKAKKENIPVHFEYKSTVTGEWYEIHAFPSEKGLTVYGHDITERKKAETALHESEAALAMAQEIAHLANWEVDINTFRVQGSEELYHLFNLAEDFNLDDYIEKFHLDDRARVVESINAAIYDGKPYNIDYRIIPRPNEIHYVHAEGHIINDKNGKPIKFFGTVQDITQRKQMEEELRQARNNLEEQVKERTAELEETITELECSNKELQSFAYITSHDLQEPLRTIASFAQLLQRRYKGKLDEDADDFLDFMDKGAVRMKNMIQGLLEYSRVGTKCKFREFNSEKALKCALTNLQSAIKEFHAEVTYEALPSMVANESQIIRIFQNLIGNAIKFRREEKPPKIHISVKKEDNEYVFSVRDNGIGLEEQYSDRIFEVFKRLHSIGEYQGAGIGLAIAKRIVDCHNGRIWVKSSLGKGSTFYFTIPLNLVENGKIESNIKK